MNFSKKTVKKTHALNDIFKVPGLKQYQSAAEIPGAEAAAMILNLTRTAPEKRNEY